MAKTKAKIIADRLSIVISIIAGVEITFATILVFFVTVSRYFWGISPEWAEELVRYCVICAAMLVSGPMVFEESHIMMDLFTQKLKNPKHIFLVKLITAVTTAICAALLFIWGIDLVAGSIGMRSLSLAYPLVIPYSIIPLSMATMFVYCILKVSDLFNSR